MSRRSVICNPVTRDRDAFMVFVSKSITRQDLLATGAQLSQTMRVSEKKVHRIFSGIDNSRQGYKIPSGLKLSSA